MCNVLQRWQVKEKILKCKSLQKIFHISTYISLPCSSSNQKTVSLNFEQDPDFHFLVEYNRKAAVSSDVEKKCALLVERLELLITCNQIVTSHSHVFLPKT